MASTMIDQQIMGGKTFLQSCTNKKNESAYDKISELIKNALTCRSDDFLSTVERQLCVKKKSKKKMNKEQSEKQVKANVISTALFTQGRDEEGYAIEQEEDYEVPLPDCMQLAFLYEQGGIGLGREETFRIFLACKRLALKHRLQSVRFWGKMMGIKANYIIAEVEYRDGVDEEQVHEIAAEETIMGNPEDEGSDNEGPREFDDLPKPQWKPPPAVPKEEYPMGANKKAYYVCNNPGEDWVKLPHVSPAQITSSRTIKKFLTGKLNTKMTSYPPFPGEEKHYLRALIARITASTHICPTGYFTFDDEDFDAEEDVGDNFLPNADFDGIPCDLLMDDKMTHWVHHIPHILPQGRCTWFNTQQKPKSDFDDDDDLDDEFDDVTATPETGPRILTSASSDNLIDHRLQAWSTRRSSNLIKHEAFAIVRSNLWPGAYTFAKGKQFDNIYIGWGVKYSANDHFPVHPPLCFEEYPSGADIVEVEDPAVEVELEILKAEKDADRENDEIDQADDDDDEN